MKKYMVLAALLMATALMEWATAQTDGLKEKTRFNNIAEHSANAPGKSATVVGQSAGVAGKSAEAIRLNDNAERDTIWVTIDESDTIWHRDTTWNTTYIHVDTFYRDTGVVIIYDTTWHSGGDTIIHTQIEVRDTTYDTTIVYTDTTEATYIAYNADTIDTVRTDTLRNTVWLYDTTYRDTVTYDTIIYAHVYRIIIDTTRQEVEAWDTTWAHAYDTMRQEVSVIDTLRHEVFDTVEVISPETIVTHATDTVWRDVQVPVYVVMDMSTGLKTTVSVDAQAVDGTNGVMLEGLTSGKDFVIYNLDGTLIVRGDVTPAGTAILRDLPVGTYLLQHDSKWSKFVHILVME